MGKGSTPRPFTNKEVFEDNFDKIFGKKKFECNTACGHYECMEHQSQCKRLNKSVSWIEQIGQNENDGIHYEYELNKSTGEVEKRFKEGTSKPNESQFDGDKPNAVKP